MHRDVGACVCKHYYSTLMFLFKYLRFTSLVVCRFPVRVSVFVAINILTSVYFTLMCLKSSIMGWYEVAHAPGQSL